MKNELRTDDCIFMGEYPYDENGQKAPIRWRVIAKRGKEALLLCEYCIDFLPFHVRTAVNWKESDIRMWAKAFYAEAFTAEERACVLCTALRTSEETTDDESADYPEDKGIVTEDHVFLLSAYEANRWLTTDGARKTVATPYAVSKGAYINKSLGGTGWWLRSRGYNVAYASDVLPNGEICGSGEEVYEENGIRPAMWVRFFDRSY